MGRSPQPVAGGVRLGDALGACEVDEVELGLYDGARVDVRALD